MIAMGLTVIGGIFFYVIRCRHRFIYGIFEIVAALGVAFFTANPPLQPLIVNPFPSDLELYISKQVAFLAAIYVFVRGMDNIGSGLTGGTRERWDSIFTRRRA